MVNDELGRRMKENYEEVAKFKLLRRTPVAIRIDGKAFHTFTKSFKKPFDYVLIESMDLTMNTLFDYEVQKMCSVSATMATEAFNTFYKDVEDQTLLNMVQKEQISMPDVSIFLEKRLQTFFTRDEWMLSGIVRK